MELLPAEEILEAHWRYILAKWNGDGKRRDEALAAMRKIVDDWLLSIGRNPSSREDMEYLYKVLRAAGVEEGIRLQAATPFRLVEPDPTCSERSLPVRKIAKALNELPTRPDLMR